MVLCVLVDPGGTAHHLADEKALGALAARFGLNNSNLRHLAGLFVGNTPQPEHVEGWRLEHEVQFLVHKSDKEGKKIVPVVGKPKLFHAYCQGRADMRFGAWPRLRKLLSRAGLKNQHGEPMHINGWFRERRRSLPLW